VPEGCVHNGHIYYVLARDRTARDRLMQRLNEEGVGATFHYVPLHSSPAGIRHGRASGRLPHTDDCAGRILRLPLFASLTEDQQDRICELLGTAVDEG
jgi:dTDP-4-amino-4,6-dideoxygalactose transaminase